MTTQTQGVWIVVGPDMFWCGTARSERNAWQRAIYLGAEADEDIAERKARGYYAARATVTWSKPT